jgi:phospholipid/cholesterol/gamma-HCH transport system permease protein
MTWIGDLGAAALRFVDDLGRLALFSGRVARAVVTPPARVRLFADELYKVGVLSLVIICICGLAVGMVLGLQGYNTLARFGATNSLGVAVGLTLIREIGPVLTALLFTGRAGSATTAEIGTMVATQQLDGLRMMSIDPVHFIVMPRVAAMVVVMPLLSALFIVTGIYGAYLVGVELMGVDGGVFLSSLETSVDFRDDIVGSFLKAFVFGVLTALIATYRGYTSDPTSAGVSRATTSTVVVGSVTILLVDYVITALWGV